jgi:HSP20 family protein
MALVKLAPRNGFGLTSDFDRLLDGIWEGRRDGLRTVSDWNPPMDVTETEDEVSVLVDLPGLNKEDIKVSVENNVLSIVGEKSKADDTEGKRYHRAERVTGSFKRTLRLPAVVDASKIAAAYKDGVLALTLPKSEVAKPRPIAIQ